MSGESDNILSLLELKGLFVDFRGGSKEPSPAPGYGLYVSFFGFCDPCDFTAVSMVSRIGAKWSDSNSNAALLIRDSIKSTITV